MSRLLALATSGLLPFLPLSAATEGHLAPKAVEREIEITGGGTPETRRQTAEYQFLDIRGRGYATISHKVTTYSRVTISEPITGYAVASLKVTTQSTAEADHGERNGSGTATAPTLKVTHSSRATVEEFNDDELMQFAALLMED